MSETRSIQVKALSRVEGEGGLHVRMDGEQIQAVELTIYEPPRFFEAFLAGRPLEETPDIVARICGICPVAYQMSAIHALEAALGIQITPEIRRLRRLLYCGEWIESHGLHMHLLHAPDFFGCASGIELAARFPEEMKRGLRLKKHGNELLGVLGGRAIHPINVAVAGFYRAPPRDELKELIPAFEWGLSAAKEATRWVAGFPFPDFLRDYELVSLVHPDEYPMNEGRIASTRGLSIETAEFEQHFREQQVPHSTALHSLLPDGRCYHVGPLARVSLNFDRLSPQARQVAAEVGYDRDQRNPFRSIVARGLELIHAYEEALTILRDYQPLRPARVEFQPRAGQGCAATEAPRGLLYHRYEVNDDGSVKRAIIVPPTSQNQRQIETDIQHWLPGILSDNHDQVALDCERLIRCYDPCISCSAHFLRLRIERNP